LNLWEEDIKKASSSQDRVDAIVTLLYNKFRVTDERRENGLVLFLQVLKEQFDEDEKDACREDLVGLIEELELEMRLPPPHPPEEPPEFHDFDFQDREELRRDILYGDANHIELYGPVGVGKTYLLKHLNKDYSDTVLIVYLKLTENSTYFDVLQESVRQLREDNSYQVQGVKDLAMAIGKLCTSGNINHIVFCLDGAEENLHQDLLQEIFIRRGLINNPKLYSFLEALCGKDMVEDLRLQIVVATLRPFIEITEYPPHFHFNHKQIVQLKKHPDPTKDPIQNMLRQLVRHQDFSLPQSNCEQISNEVYYYTGGHPKCAKLVLFGVADEGFLPRRDDWLDFFESKVLPTIEGEMLMLVSDELLPIFKVLSIFRSFDQPMLANLLENEAVQLLLEAGSIPRQARWFQARWLRKRLMEAYLVDGPQEEPVYKMNFVVRRVLYLRMRHRSPQLCQKINTLALQIFEDRLEDAKGGPQRPILSFNECIYHKLRALELALDDDEDEVDICADLRIYLNACLGDLLHSIPEMEWPTQLSVLRNRWQEDKELKEAMRRVVGDDKCYSELSQEIDNFVNK
jgi:hypothetical protein